MNILVKILVNDTGEIEESPKWHLMTNKMGNQAFCTGEFVGIGESRCEFEIKTVKRGGITCERCLQEIKRIKAVKL